MDDDGAFLARLEAALADDDRIDVVGRALDGQEAVWLAEAFQPDVILMDLGMPLFDGVWATARIHAAQPAIRILGVAGTGSVWEAGRARRAGVQAVLRRHEALRGLGDLLVAAA